VFYVFTRPQRRRPERPARPERQERKPREEARAKAKPRRGDATRPGRPRQGDDGRKPGPQGEEQPAAAARPPRQEKPVDPDNPFAALMALKLRS
jgi:ATP-dependent RNA helicase SUPV3L1/SUV3